MSTKNSRKVLSVLLAYMMVLSSFSGMAVAAKEDPAATTSYTSEVQKYEKARATDEKVTEVHDSGALREAISNEATYIKLAEDIDLTEVSEESEEVETYAAGDADLSIDYKLTLDLAGYTLTVNHLDIKDGGNLTLKDSGEDNSGTITSSAPYTIKVEQGGELTIDGGTYTNTNSDVSDRVVTINNEGTLIVEDGVITSACTEDNNTQIEVIYNSGNVTVDGGEINAEIDGADGVGIYNRAAPYPASPDDAAKRDTSCIITGGEIKSNGYGVVVMGKGYENGKIDNGSAVFKMSSGKITISGESGQGIATNASNGAFSGYTIELSGDAEVSAPGDDGCGMYLPGVGNVTISENAKVTGGLQGIRIAAGVLNIEGGTITNSSRRDDDSDLISGGSGGTAGAIVAGKASAGYVDDLIINIGNATIENTTDGDAIVVSDKNMAGSDYEKNKIEVTVSESTINGNVYTTSTIDGNDTNDGGNVSVTLNNGTTIEGDIQNTSKSPVTATEINLDGTIIVEEDTKGKVTIIDSTVTKDVDTNENIIIVNSDVNGEQTTTVTEGNIIDNKGNTYKSLDEALGKLEDGMTLILGKGKFSSTGSTITIGEDNVTILGTSAESIIQNGIMVRGDNVTIENLSVESTGKNVDAIKFSQSGSGDAIKTLTSGTVRNVTLSSDGGHGLNIHGVETMKVDGLVVKEAGKLSISISNSGTVNISNTVTADVDESHWGGGSDIGIMYTKGSPHYIADQKVTVVLGDGNEFNGTGFYSERGTLEEDPDIISCADGTILYKVLGDDDDEFYHFVESDAIVASIDDKTVNPVGYETLEDAVAGAKNGDTIDLHDDVDEDITINKDNITIDADKNQITGKVTITGENVSIENADLSEANITVDGGSANLSNNYWGGVPEDIPGATIDSYYENEDMTDDIVITNQLNWAENQIKGAQFDNIASKEANTKEAVDELVREKLDEILKGFEGEYTIVDSGFKAAVDGDAKNPDGTEGEYTFSVVLTYVGDSATVKDLTIKITPAEYVPDEPEDPDKPTEPEDPDNPKPEEPDDNDDDNSSSSGGSSGGGSFIGHPDGWVPGGIIILDGSEQVQPTGSLLLDTKTYTMAPGVVYDILATLEGASENELRVYSSQPGVASVEAIGGGKYRVTGLADGQTYIMFEVWRDGVMLNHASVKVTIADGVTAYGESNREASIF